MPSLYLYYAEQTWKACFFQTKPAMRCCMSYFSDQPLSIFGIWKSTCKVFVSTITKTWYLMALMMLIIFVIRFAIGIMHLKHNIYIESILYIINVLLILFTISILYCRIYKYDATLRESIIRSWKKFHLLLGADIIYILILAPGIFLIFSPIIFAHLQVMQQFTNIINLLVVIMIPLASIYIIYWAIAGILYKALILFDNQGIFSPIGASRRLIKNNWWRTAITIIALGMLYALFKFSILHMMHMHSLAAKISAIIIYVILSLIFFPFATSMKLVIYQSYLKMPNFGKQFCAG